MSTKEIEDGDEESEEEYGDIVVDNGFDHVRGGYAWDECIEIKTRPRGGYRNFGSALFEDKWNKLYDSITDDVSNCAVLHVLASPHVDLKRSSRWALEVHMESYGVPAFGMKDASLTAMFAMGQTNGIVIDAGTDTRVLPVQFGHGLHHVGSTFFGGDRFAMEERHLPDGNVLTLEAKHVDKYFCRATEEHIFICAGKKNPIFPGLANVFNRTMNAMNEVYDEDTLGAGFLSNVLLCGGSSRLTGMKDRLQRELDAVDGGRFKGRAIVKSGDDFIGENKNATHASYIGGTILLSVSDVFKKRCMVTKAEYQESGDRVFRKIYDVRLT